jgi:hypothetical protein
MLTNKVQYSRLAVVVLATAIAMSGCAVRAQPTESVPGTSKSATLLANDVHDDNVQFLTNRKPVLAPGRECTAFSPQMRKVAVLRPEDQPTPVVPGLGCWVNGVSVVTAKTPFGDFWRGTYSDNIGNGVTAVAVDRHEAQLFQRFILGGRYYAVQVGAQSTAGLDSGVTKTACMVVVDSGSAQPLLINLAQDVSRGDHSMVSVPQQCDRATKLAQTILDEQDPNGGSRVV